MKSPTIAKSKRRCRQSSYSIGTDSRIGKRFLFPGIGYGGSCFPKDVKALHISGKNANYDFKILDAVININTSQKTIYCPK